MYVCMHVIYALHLNHFELYDYVKEVIPRFADSQKSVAGKQFLEASPPVHLLPSLLWLFRLFPHYLFTFRCVNEYHYSGCSSMMAFIYVCNGESFSFSYGRQQEKIWFFLQFLFIFFNLSYFHCFFDTGKKTVSAKATTFV